MKSHGPWKIKETHDIYKDSFIHVWKDDVIRPDGLDGQHVVVTMKPGVCVLAIDSNFDLHLTDEFHYGIGRGSLEAVSGGIEPGECPDLTAKRELEEELGLRASQWELLTSVDPFTTIMVSPTKLYFASGLSKIDARPEGTELIRPKKIGLREAYQQVLSGQITHAPTCVLILLAYIRFADRVSV